MDACATTSLHVHATSLLHCLGPAMRGFQPPSDQARVTFCRNAMQVKMQAVGDTLLVHWQPVASTDAPSTLELRVPDYVYETPSERFI